jgi:selenocysteine-specific elongation factor
VQLVLHRPIQVCTQDRIILRNASASQTLGGGTVGDVSAPKRNRQTPQRLSYLNTQLQKDVLARWVDGLEHLPFGLRVPERLLDAGIDPETPLSSLLNRAPQSTLQKMKSVHVNADQSWLISERVLKALEHKVLELLMHYHKEHPDVLGIFQDRARKALGSQLSELIWAELLKLWLQDKKVGLKRGFLFLTQHGQSLQEADQRMAQKALPLIHDGGFEPPWVRDLALSLNVNEVQMRMSLLRLSSQGELYQIVKDLFYHPVHVQDLAQRVRDCALRSALEHGHEGVSAAQFRDACGLGRKRAIQILEFFDKIGFCRRVGDAHVVRAGTSLFSEPIA